MTIIVIPSTIVPHGRQGAHVLLGNAAERVLRATARPDRETNPSVYVESLRCFDAARGLLDRLGWTETSRQAIPVEAAYGGALLDALAEAVAVSDDPELRRYVDILDATAGDGSSL